MPQGTPHRIVDGVLDGLAEGAKGLASTVANGLKQAGEAVQSALDQPPKALGGPESVARIPDRILDGQVDAVVQAVNQGAIGALQVAGEGIQRGLDQPVEQFGIPPAFEKMGEAGSRLPKLPFGRK